MKIEEAIEIIDTAQRGEKIVKATDLHTAIKLGLEALKYHQERRKTVDAVGSPLLLGETKE